VLIVGIGSPHGDDQLGWIVVDELEVRLRERSTPPTWAPRPWWETRRAAAPVDLLDWLPGPSRLILVDACESAGQAEPWRRLAGADIASAPTRAAAGHLLGLPTVLDLARNLQRLPDRVELWAIRGESFGPGSSPSEQAVARGRQLASLLEHGLATEG